DRRRARLSGMARHRGRAGPGRAQPVRIPVDGAEGAEGHGARGGAGQGVMATDKRPRVWHGLILPLQGEVAPRSGDGGGYAAELVSLAPGRTPPVSVLRTDPPSPRGEGSDAPYPRPSRNTK